MKCKICLSESNYIFNKKILQKHEVSYYQCSNCKFIQTDPHNWLDEAYNNVAIDGLDTGIVSRNLKLARVSEQLINIKYSTASSFIDYGGGTGLFVRLMRDKGYNFYRQDIYCKNIFAKYFDINDIEGNSVFDLLTAFEVFEHLVSPIEEIEKMFTLSDSIFFTTEIQPQSDIEDWWYFVPESGQHISFYAIKSFNEICKQFNCFFFTNGSTTHMLTKSKFIVNNHEFNRIVNLQIPLYKRAINKLMYILNRENHEYKTNSLIEDDFNYVKSILNKPNK